MQKYPTVSLNSRGEGVIAWFDSAAKKLVARRLVSYGRAYGTETIVSNYAAADTPIESASAENGDVYVAWPENASSGATSRRQNAAF